MNILLPVWLQAPLAILKRIPRAGWALLAAGVVLLGLRWHWIGVGEEREHAKSEKAQARAVEIARKIAQGHEANERIAFQSINSALLKEIDDAKRKGDKVAADLRSGNLRLRHQWQGCTVPTTATSTANSDGDSELRVASAGRIIGIGAEADARLAACQSALKATGH